MASGNDPTVEMRAQLACLQQAHVKLNDELNEEHDRANHWKQRAEAAEAREAKLLAVVEAYRGAQDSGGTTLGERLDALKGGE